MGKNEQNSTVSQYDLFEYAQFENLDKTQIVLITFS